MNAEERAKVVVDPCRLELGKDASASLEYRIALEITAAQREVTVNMAEVEGGSSVNIEERAKQLASEMLRVGWLHSDIGINDGTPVDKRLAPVVGRFSEVIRAAEREAMGGVYAAIVAETAMLWQKCKIGDTEVSGMRRAAKLVRALIKELGKE